ncbi:MAG TPA: winged helix DNA-binding domain-containing protein [Actinomycetales bacterium]|nr:winged helix DNA-binding domain-containing protein [Actinomycetales bacterium]
MTTVPSLTRKQVLAHRLRTHGLDGGARTEPATAVLDLGVQDTGPDGARWALAIRGVDSADVDDDTHVLLWTLRGAPHLYRRADLPSIAAAVAPFSDTDAGKRIFDASKPLKAAGIGNLEALDAVAAAMREVVVEPMVKGEVSAAVASMMDEPYLRFCRPCNATHLYEMPFRLAAIRAGLELQPHTSPPVLQRIPRFKAAKRPKPEHDVIRGYLHLFGPATPKQAAEFIDAPVAEVKARWPEDAVPVDVVVDGQKPDQRWVLADDLVSVRRADPDDATQVSLLGPFDPYLQVRDRQLLVPDSARTKELWPTLGRPGAVLVGPEIAGTWRPRASGRKLRVVVRMWEDPQQAVWRRVEEQAERLAAFRGVALADVSAG